MKAEATLTYLKASEGRLQELVAQSRDRQPLAEAFRHMKHGLERLQAYGRNGSSAPEFVQNVGEMKELFARSNKIYEGMLFRDGKAVLDALNSGEGLLKSLLPFMSQRPDHLFDSADVLLDACLNLDISLLGQGEGRCYLPAPVRHLLRAVELLDPKSEDTVVDLGCGPGRSLAFISHLCDASLVGIEKAPELLVRAVRVGKVGCKKLPSRECRVIAGDLLHDNLNVGNKFILFEPLSGMQAATIVYRLDEVAASFPIQICCVLATSIENSAVAAGLNESRHLVRDERSDDGIILFRSRPSEGSNNPPPTFFGNFL